MNITISPGRYLNQHVNRSKGSIHYILTSLIFNGIQYSSCRGQLKYYDEICTTIICILLPEFLCLFVSARNVMQLRHLQAVFLRPLRQEVKGKSWFVFNFLKLLPQMVLYIRGSAQISIYLHTFPAFCQSDPPLQFLCTIHTDSYGSCKPSIF